MSSKMGQEKGHLEQAGSGTGLYRLGVYIDGIVE